MTTPRDHRRCKHLREPGSTIFGAVMTKHSTLTSETVSDELNATDYRWHLEVELCTFCSGFVSGRLRDVLGDPKVDAASEEGL